MPLGLSYAELIGALGATILFAPGELPPPDGARMDVAVTLGSVTEYGGTGTGPDAFVILTARPDGLALDRFRMVYGFGASDQGGLFLSAGLGKTFTLSGATLTPYVGPALYQSDIGEGFDGGELVQFRSGLDVTLPLTDGADLSLGWFHLSNMRDDADSADTDVAHLGLSFRF